MSLTHKQKHKQANQRRREQYKKEITAKEIERAIHKYISPQLDIEVTDEGTWKQMGTNVTLPRFTSVKQVIEFSNAVVRIDDPGFIKLMADGKAAYDRQQAARNHPNSQSDKSKV